MDHITLGLAVIAALSEILPLLGFTKANGLLHGLQTIVMHFHAESECNVQIETN
jgi:hypothetical protein